MADISKIKLNGTNYNIKDAVLRNKLNVTSPEVYGAAGNGTTNDTTAMTNALNSGKAVFISKTYKLTNIELTKNNLYIFGPGTLDFSAANAGLKITGDNNYIEGLSFKGTVYADGAVTATKTLLHVVGDDNIITHCNFNGGNLSGIQATGSKNTIEYCYFNKCNSHPAAGNDWGSIWFTNDSDGAATMFTDNKIIGNVIEGFNYSGICMIGKYKDTIIEGNRIKSENTNDTMGIYMFAGALGGLKIINNIIDNVYNEGIVLTDSVLAYVADNIIVKGNSLTNCGQRGIVYAGSSNSIKGGNIIVSDNSIDGSTRYLVHLSHIKKAIVNNNILKTSAVNDCNVYAIEDLEDIEVTGNTIIGNGSGVMVGCDAIIDDNIIIDSSTGVILFGADGINIQVSNNNFKNCTLAISGYGTGAGYSLIFNNTFKNVTTITKNCYSLFGFEKNVAIPSAFPGTLVNGTVDITVYAGRAGDGWIAIPIGGSGNGALTCNYNNGTTKVTVKSTDATDARNVIIMKAVNAYT